MGMVVDRWCPAQQMLGVFLTGKEKQSEEAAYFVCSWHC
jgi:hypothetical protein